MPKKETTGHRETKAFSTKDLGDWGREFPEFSVDVLGAQPSVQRLYLKTSETFESTAPDAIHSEETVEHPGHSWSVHDSHPRIGSSKESNGLSEDSKRRALEEIVRRLAEDPESTSLDISEIGRIGTERKQRLQRLPKFRNYGLISKARTFGSTLREPVVRHIDETSIPTSPLLFWRDAEMATRSRIAESLGPAYDARHYRESIFAKINETTSDLARLAIQYDVPTSGFYDLLTLVRFLNEGVYSIDYSIENDNSISRDALYISNMMFLNVRNFLFEKDRMDVYDMVPQIMVAIQANALRERIGVSSEPPWLHEYTAKCFRNFLEPSDFDYLDTGSYGKLFSKWFYDKVDDEENFGFLWNARSRVVDVIDGLIDLREEDVPRHVYSPLLLYIFFKRRGSDDQDVIRSTIDSGRYNERFEEIVHTYSRDLLGDLHAYVDGVTPNDSRVDALKDRTYDIIDLAMAITEDEDAVKRYHEFYLKPLV